MASCCVYGDNPQWIKSYVSSICDSCAATLKTSFYTVHGMEEERNRKQNVELCKALTLRMF